MSYEDIDYSFIGNRRRKLKENLTNDTISHFILSKLKLIESDKSKLIEFLNKIRLTDKEILSLYISQIDSKISEKEALKDSLKREILNRNNSEVILEYNELNEMKDKGYAEQYNKINDIDLYNSLTESIENLLKELDRNIEYLKKQKDEYIKERESDYVR